MNIQKYLKSLLPTFGKDRILEDLRLTRTEFQDFRLGFKEAASALPKLRSKEAQELARVAGNMDIPLKGGETIIAYLARNVENIIDNLDLLEKLVKQEMPDTVASQGLDLRQVNFVQLAEASSFTSRFARFLTLYLVRREYELVATEKKMEIESDTMQYEAELLAQGREAFLVSIRQLSRPVAEVQGALAEIPDMLLGKTDYAVLRSTLSATKVEPFGLSGVFGQGFEWNPIYHIRMNVVEGNELRYRECKAQLPCLQLQLQRAKLAAAGKQDARLDREITYLQNTINTVNAQIADLT